MQHSLSSYVPRLVFDRLAADRPFTGPEARIAPAAVLLSDIQGFTSLVDSFTGSGREGLEELTWLLNAYFTDLVELVYGHGGDVLYIAGDAFLCYWPADGRERLPDAVLRATQAGLAIQDKLDGRPCGDRRFATRLGVGAGDLLIAFAGGDCGRWELIVTGDALQEVVESERHAAAGQVVLSPAAWSLVEQRCRGRSLPEERVAVEAVEDGLPVVATMPRRELREARRALRPFLPPAVQDDQSVSQAEWLAQQRTVTVLLADLPQLADATQQRLQRTHASIRTFQEVVRRFEGTVKLDVDSKGIMLLAVFGLPPLAHEDDAERAIHAAWKLRESLSTSGVRCGIGIATGRAFCGAFGSELRREYMLRGNVINLAARLMQLTADEILCDHATTLAVRGRVSFEQRSPVSVKGRSQPVRVYRPAEAAQRVRRSDMPVIGRIQERKLLEEELSALRSGGQGNVVILQADAGMGKSRLVADLGDKATDADVRVLTAAADAIQRSTAYYAWRPVFRSVFGLGGSVDGASARQRVIQHMSAFPSLERLVPLLSSLLPIQIPDNELTAEMTGDVRADNTRQLLARVMQQVAGESPTLLVVEDAHWMDSSSWALLREVAQSVRPLLSVVAMRPGIDPEVPELAQLNRMAGDRKLCLEGLSSKETGSLIRQRLNVSELPPQLERFVQERVSGHPFFCEELVQSMLEAGTVRVVDGVCEVGDLRALDLPSTVEGVILSRLDRLTPGQQLCLKVASVIGRVFLQRTVRQTIPAESERLHVPDHLEVLTTQNLTVLEAVQPEHSYLFKHVLTRDVTYELIPLAARKPLHGAVADWYERNFAADLAPFYALLAYHWGQALEPVKTVAYLEKAGQQALRGGAFQEALLFFSQAIELERGGGVDVERQRRAVWEKGLGTAHYFLGDMQKSRSHFEAAVGMLDRPIPQGAAAVAGASFATATQLAHALFPSRYHGRRREAKAILDEAVECYKVLGQIYYLEGEPTPPVVYVTLRGLNVGEEAGASQALARILSNTATLFSLLGATRWADRYAARAIRMAEQEGQYSAAAYVWGILALMQAQRGDWKRAKTANDDAMKLIQELGDYNLEPETWVVRSTIHICEGDFSAAEPAWRRIRELAERNANPQILCWSLLDEVDTLLGRGQTEAAARALDAALAVPTEPSDRSSTIDKQRAVAVTRLRQGRYEEALAAADIVLDMVSHRKPMGYHWADFCASAVEVYLSVLEVDVDRTRANRRPLENRAEQGCKILNGLARNFWNVRPRSKLMRGLCYWHRQNPARALREWKAGRDIALRMDMPFEHARALLEIGRHTTGAERKSSLSVAAEIFERLGATHYLELANRARAVSN